MNEKTNVGKALEATFNVFVIIGAIIAAFISAILRLAKNS